VGLRSIRVATAGVTTSLGLGALRWVLGLFFGLIVFFGAGSIDPTDAARLYFLIYSPIRLVEWGIMAVLLARIALRGPRPVPTLSLFVWSVGGIVVSFLTDMLSPEGMQGRFCVGRCLC
jgi:hypothetical protein